MTRPNPPGLHAQPLGLGWPTLVRRGKGIHTHIFDPAMKDVICHSGKNAGKHSPDVKNSGATPKNFTSEAKYVTCYRCIKLAYMNLSRYQSFLQPAGG